MHVLEDISDSQPRISLPIASLKPCHKAGSFEYNKPYIREYFFSPLGGLTLEKMQFLDDQNFEIF